MAKDDVLEKIHELALKQALDEAEHDKEQAVAAAIKAGDDKVKATHWWWVKKLTALCLMMWSGLAFAATQAGDYLYNNYPVVKVGIDAMIAASRARQ